PLQPGFVYDVGPQQSGVAGYERLVECLIVPRRRRRRGGTSAAAQKAFSVRIQKIEAKRKIVIAIRLMIQLHEKPIVVVGAKQIIDFGRQAEESFSDVDRRQVVENHRGE